MLPSESECRRVGRGSYEQAAGRSPRCFEGAEACCSSVGIVLWLELYRCTGDQQAHGQESGSPEASGNPLDGNPIPVKGEGYQGEPPCQLNAGC
jgi:hypothetical protein